MNNKLFMIILCLIVTGVKFSFAENEAKAERRQSQVKEYAREFVSQDIKDNYPKIYSAIIETLNKLPNKVFKEVTNRRRPIIFINSITSGIARYANSTQFTVEPNDPPTFKKGFYLIILGDELNKADNRKAIEGIVAHEIAHRYLEHLTSPPENACEAERETNRLVKKWGFEEEFAAAKEEFGAKNKGDSPCQ